MRFQGFARNRMTSASGFAWFAREPKLMYGAKGRASSQRSAEYHSPSRRTKIKTGRLGSFCPFRGRAGPICLPPEPVPKELDAIGADWTQDCEADQAAFASSPGPSFLKESIDVPLRMKDRHDLKRLGVGTIDDHIVGISGYCPKSNRKRGNLASFGTKHWVALPGSCRPTKSLILRDLLPCTLSSAIYSQISLRSSNAWGVS